MKSTLAMCAGVALCLGASWRSVSEASPVIAGQELEEAPPPPRMDAIFDAMVKEAQQISRLLAEVTDKESADRVAGMLEVMLAHMGENLRALEEYSFHQEQDAEALKRHMATLTHVSQSYYATMQKLSEVNVYGSAALTLVFQRYKMDGEKLTHLQAEDLPHTSLYNELADTLEDALYCLNKVQDEASAAGAVPVLRDLQKKIDHTHHMLEQLVPPHTDEQKEVIRPVREQLRGVTTELKAASDRLKEVQFYRNRDLETLLPLMLQAAASK